MIPASTQILNEIDTRLKRILKVNGYSVDVKKVERSKKTQFTYTEVPGINYYSGNDVIEKDFGVSNHSLPVTIEFIDRTMDKPFNDVAAERAAEIVKCLAENVSGISHNLGDLVDSVDIQAITPVIDQQKIPFCGAIVDLIINYKTDHFDHFTII